MSGTWVRVGTKTIRFHHFSTEGLGLWLPAADVVLGLAADGIFLKLADGQSHPLLQTPSQTLYMRIWNHHILKILPLNYLPQFLSLFKNVSKALWAGNPLYPSYTEKTCWEDEKIINSLTFLLENLRTNWFCCLVSSHFIYLSSQVLSKLLIQC